MTIKEFELLRYLMSNPQVVLSREAIMRSVWETDYEGESRTVDMHIKTLRQKLGDQGRLIGTVRNVGYVISDTGIGIPKDQQEKVFERFYRVDKSRSRETGGTGLGLAIVKHIAEIHDAELTLISEPGQGITVRVRF